MGPLTKDTLYYLQKKSKWDSKAYYKYNIITLSPFSRSTPQPEYEENGLFSRLETFLFSYAFASCVPVWSL